MLRLTFGRDFGPENATPEDMSVPCGGIELPVVPTHSDCYLNG